MEINCKICGVEIERRGNTQKYCKSCSIKKTKEYMKTYNRNYRERNEERISLQKGEYSKKPEVIAHRKEYQRKYSKKYWQKNKEKLKKYRKEHRKKNKEKEKRRHRRYRKENKEKIRKYSRLYFPNKYKNDKNFKISCNLRNQLNRALIKYTKTGKIMTSKQYGIDYKRIIEHLKPFPKDLRNYQIHHIKPLFTFNFVNPDGSTNLNGVKKAFLPQNHKLLTIKEHRGKHRKLNETL